MSIHKYVRYMFLISIIFLGALSTYPYEFAHNEDGGSTIEGSGLTNNVSKDGSTLKTWTSRLATPTISYISPTQSVGTTFNLEINGSNFDSGAVDQIYWKADGHFVGQGSVLSRTTTRIVSQQSMTGATPGTYVVKVRNSDGSLSNGVDLVITSAALTPAISYISPTQSQGITFNLEINGSNFDSGAVDQIYWKSSGSYIGQGTIQSRTSTRVVSQQHMAGITPGTYLVKIKNSDGSLSNGIDLVITSTPNPQVTISPSSGAKGTQFSAPGSQFTAYGTAVLHLKKPDGTEFSTITKSVDQNGSYSHTIDSASFTAGTYSYWAVDSNRGLSSNTVTFTVTSSSTTPTISSINPTQAVAGTFNLTINGSNYDSGAVDQIYWKPDMHLVGQGTIQSRTSTQIVSQQHMTGTTPGTYVVKVKNSDGSLSNGVDLAIISSASPQVSVSPSSGPKGTQFSAPGTGFTASGTVVLHLKKPDGSEYPTINKTANSSGAYSHTIDSTSLVVGAYQYWAVDSLSGKSSNTVSFNVTSATSAPTISSIDPVQATPGTFDLTINGLNFDTGAVDQIFWKPDMHLVGQGTIQSRTSTRIVSQQHMTGSTPGTYVVKVKNSDGSLSNGVDLVITGNGQPPIAQLTASPTSGNPPLLVLFNAASSYDPDGGTIQSYNYNFGDGLVSGWITSKQVDHNYVGSGTFAAKVQVTDDEGTVSDWSSATTIAIDTENTATVKGRVVDKSGNGIYGASILLDGAADYSTQSDANGAFILNAVKLDSYACSVTKSYYDFSPSRLSVSVTSASTYELSPFIGEYRPDSKYDISGRIIDGGGSGLHGVAVTISGAAYLSTSSDSSGYFNFPGLSKGSYKITPDNKQYAFFPVSQEISITSANVTLKEFQANQFNLKIRGKVLKSGGTTGIPNAKIELSGKMIQTTQSDATGAFTFSGLKNGDYIVKPISGAKEFNPKQLSVYLRDEDCQNLVFKAEGQLNEIQVGKLTIYADAIEKLEGNRYNATGQVRIGDIIDASGDLTIDLDKIEIVGNCRLTAISLPVIGSLLIYEGSFTLQLGKLDYIVQSIPALNIYGFKFKLIRLEITNNTVGLGAQLVLPSFLQGVELNVGLDFSPKGVDIAFNTKLPYIKIPGTPWGLEDTNLDFNSKDRVFSGGTMFDATLWKAGGNIRLKDGRVTDVGVKCIIRHPILPPLIFLDKISGSLRNLDDNENMEIEAGAGISAGPSFHVNGKDKAVLYAEMSIIIQLSNHITGKGTLEIFTFNVAEGSITFIPDEQIEARGTLDLFNIFKASSDLVVDKAGEVRGEASGQVVIKKGSICNSLPLKDICSPYFTAEFTNNKLVISFPIWIWLAKIPITVELTPGSLTVYAWDEVIFPWDKENQRNRSYDNSSLMVKRHQLPKGLREAHFITRWSKNNADPELITPSGLHISKDSSLPGISYHKFDGARLAFYIVRQPEAGLWTFVIPNESNLGSIRCSVAKYDYGPAFHFRKVTALDGKAVRIEWSQSGGKETKVDLLYGSLLGKEAKMLLASSRKTAGKLEWIWDASRVKPGQYYIYARITDETSQPIVLRSAKPVKIDPSVGINPPQNVHVKLRNNRVHVYWAHPNPSRVDYFKLYYGTAAEDSSLRQFISCRSTQNHIVLDAENLKPGRTYDIALSAVYKSNQKSDLSAAKSVVYRCRGMNNLPAFSTLPKGSAVVDKKYVYLAKATDMDNNKISYALEKAPLGMRINSRTGEIAWIPNDKQVGMYWIKVLAIDNKGGVEQQQYTLAVLQPKIEGDMELRPLICGSQQGLMLIYRNAHLNLVRDQFETLTGRLGSGRGYYEIPISLVETQQDSGLFTTFIPLETMQSVAFLPQGLMPASTAELSSPLVDEIQVRLDGENRTEVGSYRYLRQR